MSEPASEGSAAELLARFRAELAEAGTDESAVDAVRVAFVGKSGHLKKAFGVLRTLPAEERPGFAASMNEARGVIEQAIADAQVTAREAALSKRFDAEWLDLSLPGVASPRGALHPVTVVERECLTLLRRLGFEFRDGPEVETPFYNFDALNIPEHHPARDMQDTFWLPNERLLRSHTTTVQARELEARPELPIKVVSAGRVYRNEAVDATHLAMFHQLEGFWLDKGITLAHLKGVLSFVVRALYGEGQRLRFKPKFYPYTEPSIGVDLACTACDGEGCNACHGAGWITVLGAGMIHRNVLEQFGYDPDEVAGIAFGLGTTRMAAQYVGTDRVRSMYQPNLRLLQRIHRRQP